MRRPNRRFARRLGAALLAVVALTAVAVGLRADSPPSGPFSVGTSGVGDSYLPTAGNGGYDVRHYGLDLRYTPDTDRLDGDATIEAVALYGLRQFNLDFGELTVAALTVDGRAARWRRTGPTELEVTPARPVRAGAAFTVRVRYAGTPGGDRRRGFLRTSDGAVVAGEPEASADWFPANDHPRDKATYDFAITVPEGLTAIANGVPAGVTNADGRSTWRWRVTSPMASYLATMAVGRYRIVTDTRGSLPVFSAVSSSLAPGVADEAVARTPEIAYFLATLFGPYPFEALGAIVPPAGTLTFALENQTRPVYSARFFERGTPGDKTWVIAHELAHQWFGDSVSVDDWRHIWLNEGFATYAEWLWGEHLGYARADETFEREYARGDAEFWRLRIGDPGAQRLFAAAVYRRGAMTVHALRRTVGDEAFFRILPEWTATYRHSTATTEQFVALAERISGRELDTLFQEWLFGTERPARP